MVSTSIVVAAVLATAHGVLSHFALSHPSWRADSLDNDSYSQWTYPCAGVGYGAGNVTDWPLDGGSLQLELHHAWTYVFVNLGLGRNTSNFNISLTPEFWNATGKGTLCVEKLPVPVPVTNGSLASLQVVTIGKSGSALYNCADIRFLQGAKTLENCASKGINLTTVRQQQDGPAGNAAAGQQGPAANKSLASSASVSLYTVAFGGLCALASVGLGLSW
ncbi:hypothetical protein L249_0469 [Ophiocordyceps polyrhachis-furcata BCC 54312]|uniref:Copper acquisition factor BIM1-like domain-containing protein n=1 Tax=Ophiocordyceps polyrhachis-furcata BCC 54312 TaxID=1330021 RepID=A0A367LF09_9HYPO|nr:hypothetical protein L249_0469 [Ophiocordyceps polyrhachis-furcata BCC 54312]